MQYKIITVDIIIDNCFFFLQMYRKVIKVSTIGMIICVAVVLVWGYVNDEPPVNIRIPLIS